MARSGSSRVVTSALVIRAGALLAATAAFLVIRYSTFETSFASRYLHDPSEDQIFRAIAGFRFLNHLPVAALGLLASAVAWGATAPLVGRRLALFLRALIPAVIAYIAFSLAVQRLPVSFLVVFLLLGGLLSAGQVFANRIARDGQGFIAKWLVPTYLSVPFLSEVVTPRLGFRELYGVRSLESVRPRFLTKFLLSIAPAWTMLALFHGASYMAAISAINSGRLPDLIVGRRVERIVEGNYHGLELDERRNRLLVTNMDLNRLEAFSFDERPKRMFVKPFPTQELENIRINPARDEMYHFDRRSERLRVYNAEDFSLKRESTAAIDGGGTAQLEFDNESKTILVTRESDFVWLFDMDSLTLIHQHPEYGGGNADVLFSAALKAYVLTYYVNSPLFRTLTPTDGRYAEFATLEYQNDVQESLKRMELYLSLPIEGAVYVYDLRNPRMQKRVLRTVFGVRGIAYDKTHDLLLTTSMVNGHLDVLEVGSGRIRDRVFVGYYLREIVLNEARREAFISSRVGGVFRFRY